MQKRAYSLKKLREQPAFSIALYTDDCSASFERMPRDKWGESLTMALNGSDESRNMRMSAAALTCLASYLGASEADLLCDNRREALMLGVGAGT